MDIIIDKDIIMNWGEVENIQARIEAAWVGVQELLEKARTGC